MRGISVPATHTYMIRSLQKLYSAAKQKFKLSSQKVAGHSDNAGNDMADYLADLGARGIKTRFGRHNENPPRNVTIPPRPLDPHWLSPLSLSQQTSLLLQSIRTASDAELPKQPLIQRKTYISNDTWKKYKTTMKIPPHLTTPKEHRPLNKLRKMQGRIKQHTFSTLSLKT